MTPRIVPALCILALGLISSMIVLAVDALSGDWVVHAGSSVLAAGVLAAVAGVQKWTHFAWLPVLGFAVASGGFIAGQSTVVTTGLFAFAVLTVWHGHQQEGNGRLRLRKEAPA